MYVELIEKEVKDIINFGINNPETIRFAITKTINKI